jgi:hypothetical protein
MDAAHGGTTFDVPNTGPDRASERRRAVEKVRDCSFELKPGQAKT